MYKADNGLDLKQAIKIREHLKHLIGRQYKKGLVAGEIADLLIYQLDEEDDVKELYLNNGKARAYSPQQKSINLFGIAIAIKFGHEALTKPAITFRYLDDYASEFNIEYLFLLK